MKMSRRLLAVPALAGTLLGLAYCFYISYHTFVDRDNGYGHSPRGLVIPPPSGYSWSTHDGTLVLVMRADCRFCQESLPFYHRLRALENANQLRVHVLAVMPDDRTTGQPFLAANGVDGDSMFDVPLKTLHVSATPTILLVDPRGQVASAWIGHLAPKGEQDVVDMIRN